MSSVSSLSFNEFNRSMNNNENSFHIVQQITKKIFFPNKILILFLDRSY